MFTGLIEEIGTIKEYKSIPDGKEAWIEGHIVIDDLKKDDSISCSGICLTVVETKDQFFRVQLVNETLEKSTARYWAKGTKINVFATTPHFNESANTATASPKIMQNVGTRISHIKLFLIANLN